MVPWINYHHLQYFKIIAEEGSVSKAAARLRIGQPTLSVQLRQLEDALGVQLFTRERRKLVLTEHGRIALDYSKGIFRLGSEMVEALHDRLRPARPTLHVGALDCIPKQVVLRLTRSALKFGPCQLTLTEGNLDELLRELATHRMDLVLSDHIPSGTDAKGLHPRLLGRAEVAFFGAPRFRAFAKGFPKSLSEVPLILPTYSSRLRSDIEHWAKNHGVALDVVVESEDVAVKKLLAADGIGIIPASVHATALQVASGRLVRIGLLRGVHEETWLLSTQRRIANPVAARLMKSFHL